MFRSYRLVALALAASLTLAGVAGAPAALATSATANQNPELTVSVALPDRAVPGDTVTAHITIKNNTFKLQNIVVNGVRTDPLGATTVETRNVMLVPGQLVRHAKTYTIDETFVAGTHQVTVTAENRNGASSATATIEVVVDAGAGVQAEPEPAPEAEAE